jgi:hypothetical protein
MADDGDSPKLEPQSGNRMVRAVRRMMERGRSGLELRQLNKDLDHFWVRLGKTAYHLVVAGEIDHPALRKAMERIEELEGRIDTRRGEPKGE